MYEYFEGLITNVTPSYVVVEVAGIGYKVLTANPYRYSVSDQAVRIYIHQAIRDTEQALFGFYDEEEKALFEKLLNVSGIGPKSALAILANADHSGLINAINQDDYQYLTRFPGIGKKTAQQIVLDLKGKLADLQASLPGEITLDVPEDTATDGALGDAIAALRALGYSQKEVKTIRTKLADFEEAQHADTNQLLSEGLRLLMGKK